MKRRTFLGAGVAIAALAGCGGGTGLTPRPGAVVTQYGALRRQNPPAGNRKNALAAALGLSWQSAQQKGRRGPPIGAPPSSPPGRHYPQK